MCLCLSEKEYRAALQHLDIEEVGAWVKDGADATAHYMRTADGRTSVVVCLKGHAERTPVQVAAMLVHEAVHIWQYYCDDMGERSPGAEQEAYAIQNLSQTLMEEFSRRVSID